VPLDVVDVHTHAFPDQITGREWAASVGVPDSKRSGHIAELGSLMAEGGIGRAVILLFDRGPDIYAALIAAGRSKEFAMQEVKGQILAYNRWGCDVAAREPRYLPFIGVNARFMSPVEVRQEIAAMKVAGAAGVKIVPAAMGVYPNDRLLDPIFEACTEHGMPLLSQSGRDGGAPSVGADAFGRPKYWADVMARFPGLTLVLAHLGRGHEDDIVDLTHRFSNVFTDTSLRLSGLGKPDRWTAADLVEMIRRIGVDRVLFGSNYPFVNPAVYVTILEQLPLKDRERRMIAAENFDHLMRAVGGGTRRAEV